MIADKGSSLIKLKSAKALIEDAENAIRQYATSSKPKNALLARFVEEKQLTFLSSNLRVNDKQAVIQHLPLLRLPELLVLRERHRMLKIPADKIRSVGILEDIAFRLTPTFLFRGCSPDATLGRHVLVAVGAWLNDARVQAVQITLPRALGKEGGQGKNTTLVFVPSLCRLVTDGQQIAVGEPNSERNPFTGNAFQTIGGQVEIFVLKESKHGVVAKSLGRHFENKECSVEPSHLEYAPFRRTDTALPSSYSLGSNDSLNIPRESSSPSHATPVFRSSLHDVRPVDHTLIRDNTTARKTAPEALLSTVASASSPEHELDLISTQSCDTQRMDFGVDARVDLDDPWEHVNLPAHMAYGKVDERSIHEDRLSRMERTLCLSLRLQRHMAEDGLLLPQHNAYLPHVATEATPREEVVPAHARDGTPLARTDASMTSMPATLGEEKRTPLESRAQILDEELTPRTLTALTASPLEAQGCLPVYITSPQRGPSFSSSASPARATSSDVACAACVDLEPARSRLDTKAREGNHSHLRCATLNEKSHNEIAAQLQKEKDTLSQHTADHTAKHEQLSYDVRELENAVANLVIENDFLEDKKVKLMKEKLQMEEARRVLLMENASLEQDITRTILSDVSFSTMSMDGAPPQMEISAAHAGVTLQAASALSRGANASPFICADDHMGSGAPWSVVARKSREASHLDNEKTVLEMEKEILAREKAVFEKEKQTLEREKREFEEKWIELQAATTQIAANVVENTQHFDMQEEKRSGSAMNTPRSVQDTLAESVGAEEPRLPFKLNPNPQHNRNAAGSEHALSTASTHFEQQEKMLTDKIRSCREELRHLGWTRSTVHGPFSLRITNSNCVMSRDDNSDATPSHSSSAFRKNEDDDGAGVMIPESDDNSRNIDANAALRESSNAAWATDIPVTVAPHSDVAPLHCSSVIRKSKDNDLADVVSPKRDHNSRNFGAHAALHESIYVAWATDKPASVAPQSDVTPLHSSSVVPKNEDDHGASVMNPQGDNDSRNFDACAALRESNYVNWITEKPATVVPHSDVIPLYNSGVIRKNEKGDDGVSAMCSKDDDDSRSVDAYAAQHENSDVTWATGMPTCVAPRSDVTPLLSSCASRKNEDYQGDDGAGAMCLQGNGDLRCFEARAGMHDSIRVESETCMPSLEAPHSDVTPSRGNNVARKNVDDDGDSGVMRLKGDEHLCTFDTRPTPHESSCVTSVTDTPCCKAPNSNVIPSHECSVPRENLGDDDDTCVTRPKSDNDLCGVNLRTTLHESSQVDSVILMPSLAKPNSDVTPYRGSNVDGENQDDDCGADVIRLKNNEHLGTTDMRSAPHESSYVSWTKVIPCCATPHSGMTLSYGRTAGRKNMDDDDNAGVMLPNGTNDLCGSDTRLALNESSHVESVAHIPRCVAPNSLVTSSHNDSVARKNQDVNVSSGVLRLHGNECVHGADARSIPHESSNADSVAYMPSTAPNSCITSSHGSSVACKNHDDDDSSDVLHSKGHEDLRLIDTNLEPHESSYIALETDIPECAAPILLASHGPRSLPNPLTSHSFGPHTPGTVSTMSSRARTRGTRLFPVYSGIPQIA